MKKINSPLNNIWLLLLLFLVGCGWQTTPVGPAPSPEGKMAQASPTQANVIPTQAAATQTVKATRPTPTPTAEVPPPVVLHPTSKQNREHPLDAPIEITFDQPMDRASVQSAFTIEPGDVEKGRFKWLDKKTVRFILKDGFQPEQAYQVRLDETAQSEDGVSLAQPFAWDFRAVEALTIVKVNPAAGATRILPDKTVTVYFNHPVVPLTAVDEASNLPRLLTFDPPVPGEGQWLDTSTYQFKPDSAGFRRATEYTVRVAQGLTDASGELALLGDVEWRFTTIMPTPTRAPTSTPTPKPTPTPVPLGVIKSSPKSNSKQIDPNTAVKLVFSYPMHRRHVQENFSLVHAGTGAKVSGEFSWSANPGARTICF